MLRIRMQRTPRLYACAMACLLMAPVAALRAQAPAPAPADQAAPRTDANSMLAHDQLLEKAGKGGIDIYFEGDSITRRWGATDYPELLANWLFKPGEHLIIHNDLYGGTYRLLALLAERGIEIEYVDLRDEAAVRAAVRPATRAIWIESPTNPCMNLVDLAAIAAMARAAGVLTICDNTFLSPYFQRPLDLGVDIVLHSTTK